MRQMHQSIAKTRLILGGKRSGKTRTGFFECAWAGLGIHPYLDYPPPPLKIRICSVDYLSGVRGIILPLFHQFFGRFDNGPLIKKYWAEDRIIELQNGTEYDLKSYEQDIEKFEGVPRDICWMDEEPRKDIYQSNYLRTIDTGGKLLITCTPLHGMTWIFDDLYSNPEAVPPYIEWWHVKTSENPYINEKELEDMKHNPALRDNLHAALEGEFVPKSGLVYPYFEDRNIIDPIVPTDDMMIILGIDPHDRNPHGVAFAALDKENQFIIYDEILEKSNIPDLVAKIKAKLGKRFPPQLAVMDTSGNVVQVTSGLSVQEQMLRLGLYTISANKDVQAGRLRVNSYMYPGKGIKPKLYVTKNCVNVIREYKHHIWDEWNRRRDQKDPKEKVVKKDDHLLDDIRYICMLNITYRHPDFVRRPSPPERKSNVTGYFLGR